MENLKEWLSGVISGLVSKKDTILITETTDEQGLFYDIRVDKEDVGKLIGKKGQHAAALRLLLRCAGSLYDQRAALKINTKE